MGRSEGEWEDHPQETGVGVSTRPSVEVSGLRIDSLVKSQGHTRERESEKEETRIRTKTGLKSLPAGPDSV